VPARVSSRRGTSCPFPRPGSPHDPFADRSRLGHPAAHRLCRDQTRRTRRPGRSAAARGAAGLPRDARRQRQRALAPFAAPARRDWHFIPRERPGVLLGELDLRQRTALHALLDTTLSTQGHLKVDGIVRLEDVLFELQSRPGAPASQRDPGRYAFQAFGTPGQGPWAWRFEGHHVALDFTSTPAGPTRTTPFFLGVSPARIADGPHAGTRILAVEQDLGAALILALDEAQRAAAHLAGESPMDVVLGPGADRGFERAEGLALGGLDAAQRALVTRLLDEFAGNLAPDLALSARRRFDEGGLSSLRFGWNGDMRTGGAHYWRITGARFAIEYADVDGGTNHFHCVWRDLDRDFGADLLQGHLADGHGHAGR
jgi:hypothetical protein